MGPPQQRPLRLLTNLDPERYIDNPRAFHVYELKEHGITNTSNWFEVTGEEAVFRECQELTPFLSANPSAGNFDLPVDVEENDTSCVPTTRSESRKTCQSLTSEGSQSERLLFFDVTLNSKDGSATFIPLKKSKIIHPRSRVSSLSSPQPAQRMTTDAAHTAKWQSVPISAGPYGFSYYDHCQLHGSNIADVVPRSAPLMCKDKNAENVQDRKDPGFRCARKRSHVFDGDALSSRPSLKRKESSRRP